MGIIAAGQITVVDLSDAPVLNAAITASRPTTQTYSKDSGTYNPSYESTPQVLTLSLTKSGSTTNIIDSISSLHWFVADGYVKTEITSKDNTANEYISGTHNEILTTKLDININKGSRRYEVMGIWPDPSTGLDVHFGGYIDLFLTQNGATGAQGPQGPQGDKGDTGNGIANTVITYGLSMSDTTEPATWSSERPALVKGMYLWIRTVIIYTNGESTTSYQIGYIPQDADASAEIDKAKQELLEKLETVRDDSLEAVEEAKQQLATVRDESLAAAEEAKQGLINVNTKVDNAKAELTQAKQQLTTVSDDLSKAKTDFQNAVSAVDTKATNLKNDLTQAKQDLASQAQQLQEQASAQSELTNRVSSVEKTANSTKTTVSELSKTVAQNGKDITSVTARTKVVEDDLSGTKTTLSQVQTTANSASQKTATLETGLNGLSAKFENLKIGSRNYFKDSKSRKYYINDAETQDVRTYIDDEFWQNDTRFTKDYVRMSFDIAFNPALPSDFTTNVHFGASPWYNCGGITFKGGTTALQHFDLKFDLSGAGNSYKTDNVFIRLKNTIPLNTAVSLENFNLYLSAVVEDYSQNEADIESKVAEYKQNADQNYASLQTTVQNLDGTVQHNKTVADQTAQGFTTRIESLETYKDGETTRANQYFESAKTETARQLTAERTAIAKDYVAKSTYTSDVTGIRNDLTATTTTANTIKTNLANYQASNDRAVANLQSNLQTANGNISSLKTKVEAVPGQITSAVSSVESKIPTNVSTRNLILKSNDFANPHKATGDKTTVTSTNDYFVLKSTGYTANGYGGISWNMSISEVKAGEEFSILMPVYIDSSVNLDNGWAFILKNHSKNSAAYDYTIPTNKKNQWFNVAFTFKAYKDVVFDSYPFYVCLVKNGLVRIKPPMLVRGNLIPSDYQPAFEDTQTKITTLNTTLTQTANGLEQLSTKVTSQGNTINTHTTQISALNTGLQAKVSQTDFNTLSGRVTSAENNITAKANELSSKITSVEGKIPSGEMNLVEYGRPANGYSPYAGAEYTTHGFYYNSAFKMYIIRNTTTSEKMLSMNRFKVERNTEYTLYFKGFNNGSITNMDVWFLKRVSGSTKDYDSAQQLVIGRKFSVSRAEDVSVTFNTGNYDEGYLRFDNNGTTTAGTSADLYFGDVSVKKGKSNNGWSPSLAELASSQDLKSAQSEIKQTKDGMTLLATKTELSTAKNDLQSGINTATNKANAAQNTANSNAQTINTHTTQISALNTGLQAKVSQSEFNTLSGRVTTAENNITAKANELSSKISSVEGKIPTSVGGRNYIKDSEYRKASITVNDNQSQDEAFNISPAFWQNSNVYNKKIKLSFYYQASVAYGTERKFPVYFRESPWPWIGEVTYPANTTRPIKYTMAMTNALPANFTAPQIFIRFTGNLDKGRDHTITKVMLEVSDVFSDWQPAPEDTATQISSLSSELKQTKDGITLLATKTELNSAKNDLQSGINTATNKANAAQNTANSAQNKANSNAQTINTHTTQISALNTGLSAKVSQSDFNTLSGRVTTAENNITAKANELSSKISSVEGKIPSGETNLVEYGRPANGYSPYAGAEYTTHGFYYNGAFKMYIIRNSTTSEKLLSMNRFKVERNTEYTLYFKGFNNWEITNMDVWFLKRVNGSKNDYDSAQILVSNRKLSNGAAENISVTFNTGEYDEGYLRFDNNGTTTAGTSADLYFGDVSVKKGRSNKGWSPSWSELATSQDLKNAQSEFKQTTDSIKASVSSLDKSTVKSSSLTINSDGIVMKAGKTTTDVANAIGSYFSVNQNAINLFSDKISVKGNMIVNGTITGDKIKASSVDVSKIVGIDANFIKSKIEYAMIDWLKGKTITAYNGNMTIDLQNGRISFKDGSNAVYRQTSDGIHTGFLHFEAGPQGGIQAAFGATSMRQFINSKTSAFAGIRCYRVSAHGDSHEAKIDKIELIGDVVQFGHGYASEGNIGGGFIMDNAIYREDKPYSLNRMVRSIESLWRILHDHARNVGYNLSDQHFINALNDEYNAWYDMHNK